MAQSKKRNPGIYVLIFHLSRDVPVAVGRLGELDFQTGWYGYVGSGKSGVKARVRRHLRSHNRPHWHLDYLLPLGQPTAAVIGYTDDSLECPLARRLEQRCQVIPRFGSSDCRCPGHLFHSSRQASLEDAAVQGMTALGCTPLPIPVDWNWDPTII
ncbi:MAG: GIY-YIG nuclease family protein [Dehalococcoidia bacterium]|nr:GIY-YIG nuclease family protein [Dehalococcoidia bacterium]